MDYPVRSISIGAVAGVATAAGVMFGRKAMTQAKVGQGHPLKHRMLDLASGAIQPKYPLSAMSTYLNGFHMYADELGRRWRRRISASICAMTCTSV